MRGRGGRSRDMRGGGLRERGGGRGVEGDGRCGRG